MKTEPMAHQTEGLARLDGKRYYALFCEQGTGKTWIGLADAERAFGLNKINGLLVVAPKGVHTNWTRREIPTHLSTPYTAAAYLSGNKTAFKACLALNKEAGDKLRILSINIDALNHKQGRGVARAFLENHEAMMIVDESHRIKTHNTGVTKQTFLLGRLAKARRIATGTPLVNSPPDMFSQFEFLRPGLLNQPDYRTFLARYAELENEGDRTMRYILHQQMNEGQRKAIKEGRMPLPQVIRRDANNLPRWRNLDELRELIEPHAYRVLKKDCLDLPEKIYQTRDFDLSPALRAVYNRLQRELILEVGEDLLAVHALAARTKLMQLTSGFALIDGVPRYVEENNPRLELLREVVTDQQGQFIVWAHFREEIAAIMRLLVSMKIPAVEYHGDVRQRAREDAVDGFQEGRYRAFVGQPGAGGVGLTLTAAETVIYFSHDFNYGHRSQSEDRSHRKGTVRHVLYINLIAADTIDEVIAAALRRKEDIAAEVLGDER